MLVYKIAYSLYDSFRHKKSFEEIIPLSTVEKIIGGLKCPKDFYCYKWRYDSLSNKGNSGMKSFSTCLDDKLQDCAFSVLGQNNFLCKCPLREYIFKELRN